MEAGTGAVVRVVVREASALVVSVGRVRLATFSRCGVFSPPAVRTGLGRGYSRFLL